MMKAANLALSVLLAFPSAAAVAVVHRRKPGAARPPPVVQADSSEPDGIVKTSESFSVGSESVGLLGHVSALPNILRHVKLSRDAVVAVFSAASQSLAKSGHSADALELQQWTDRWLSLAGVTSLAKEFTLNYLGRQAYHHKNGHFIKALKSLIPDVAEPSAAHVAIMRRHALRACHEGKELFVVGGSLHQMLAELEPLLARDKIAAFIEDAVKFHPKAKEALRYLVSPPPRSGSDAPAFLESQQGAFSWVGVVILAIFFTIMTFTVSSASFVYAYLFGKDTTKMKQCEFPPPAQETIACPYQTTELEKHS